MNFSFERDRIEQLLRLYSALASGNLRFKIRGFRDSAVVIIRNAIRFRAGVMVRVGVRPRVKVRTAIVRLRIHLFPFGVTLNFGENKRMLI